MSSLLQEALKSRAFIYVSSGSPGEAFFRDVESVAIAAPERPLYYVTHRRPPSPLPGLDKAVPLRPEDLGFLIKRMGKDAVAFIETKTLTFWDVMALTEAKGTVVFHVASQNDTIKALKASLIPFYVRKAGAARETLRSLLQRLMWMWDVSKPLNAILEAEEALYGT